MGVHAVVGEILCDDVVDNDIAVVEEDDATGFVGAVEFLFGRLFVAFGAIIDAVFVPDGLPWFQIFRRRLEMEGEHFSRCIEEPWSQSACLQLVGVEPQAVSERLPVIGGNLFSAGEDGSVGFNGYGGRGGAAALEDHGFVIGFAWGQNERVARRQFRHSFADGLERLFGGEAVIGIVAAVVVDIIDGCRAIQRKHQKSKHIPDFHRNL